MNSFLHDVVAFLPQFPINCMVQATRHGRSFLGGVYQGAFDESQRVHEGRLFLTIVFPRNTESPTVFALSGRLNLSKAHPVPDVRWGVSRLLDDHGEAGLTAVVREFSSSVTYTDATAFRVRSSSVRKYFGERRRSRGVSEKYNYDWEDQRTIFNEGTRCYRPSWIRHRESCARAKGDHTTRGVEIFSRPLVRTFHWRRARSSFREECFNRRWSSERRCKICVTARSCAHVILCEK